MTGQTTGFVLGSSSKHPCRWNRRALSEGAQSGDRLEESGLGSFPVAKPVFKSQAVCDSVTI